MSRLVVILAILGCLVPGILSAQIMLELSGGNEGGTFS